MASTISKVDCTNAKDQVSSIGSEVNSKVT